MTRRLTIFALVSTFLTSSSPILAEPTAGLLVGKVLYADATPPAERLDVMRDAVFCGAQIHVQRVSVNQTNRGLEGAVVSVEIASDSEPDNYTKSAVITNRGCAFHPRVLATRVGQSIEIRSDDPVMHNTHITRETQTMVNVALVPQGRPIVKPVKKPGIYAVKCDAHKFMTAHLIAFPHAFFAVTDDSGVFRISGLPPGDHWVTVWHESLGTKRERITIPPRGEAGTTIEYTSRDLAPTK